MPSTAKFVGRPSVFGNPFPISAEWDAQRCVDAYREWIHRPDQIRILNLAKELMKGRDLACWCPLTDEDGNPVPCHADVLLEIANTEVPSETR